MRPKYREGDLMLLSYFFVGVYIIFWKIERISWNEINKKSCSFSPGFLHVLTDTHHRQPSVRFMYSPRRLVFQRFLVNSDGGRVQKGILHTKGREGMDQQATIAKQQQLMASKTATHRKKVKNKHRSSDHL